MSTKNSAWVESPDEEVTGAEFVSHLSPIAVCLDRRGVELSYAAGRLFWGHLVVVMADLDGTFQQATLAG